MGRNLLVLAMLGLAACSAPRTPESNGETSTSGGDTPRVTPTASTQSSSVAFTDHDLTSSDCRVLGQKYRDLTIADQEKANLRPGLTPEKREEGERAIAEAADKLTARYVDSC